MNFGQERVSRAKKVDADFKRLNTLQAKRTKAVGEQSQNITQKINKLKKIRKSLPPIQDAEDYTFPSEGRFFHPTAGISGIYNDDNDVAFWAGSDLTGAIWTAINPFDLNPPKGHTVAPFCVTHGGMVVANQAIIRGQIFAEDGVFSGTVYASAGEFNGKITSNANGDRLIIDPEDRSMKMINSLDQEVVRQDFFLNNRYSGGQIRVNLVDQGNGKNHCHAVIDGGRIAVYRDGVVFVRFDAYQKKIWIDANLLPQSREEAYKDEIYIDGENMKIRRG